MTRPRIRLAFFAAATCALFPSTARATATTIGPYEHGSIALELETGDRGITPICEEESAFRMTPTRRHQLIRGVAEFQLPAVRANYSRATLFLWETREILTAPRPVETHVVSFYPADLSVRVDDFDRPTIVLDTVETDANETVRTFRIDVTSLVRDFASGNLGFRIQLANETMSDERDVDGAAGSTFAAWLEIRNGEPPVRNIVVDAVPCFLPPVLNHAGRPVVAAVLLGGADVDVADVDAPTMRLLGVPASAWGIRDFAMPGSSVDGAVRSLRARDGAPDLLLCFDLHNVAIATRHLLGRRPTFGDTIPLLFTGRMGAAFDRESIACEDRVSLNPGGIE